MNDMISVIIPSYNEEKMIEKTCYTIGALLKNQGIPYEIIFVDDGSKDTTWNTIQEVALKYPSVKGIAFSRNFGKEAAIYAGLLKASGNCSVVIDCDLQHPPEKIIEMYYLWKNEGYEIVEAIKVDRGKENIVHTFAANMFYSIISSVTQIDMKKASDFKLLDKKAVTVLLNMKERNTFFRALSSWIGFKSCQVEFEVQERTEGESKWSTSALIKYALSNISSFSAIPMQIVTVFGTIMFVLSIVLGSISLLQKISGTALEGFTTVIILQLLSSSLIMICLGIMGYYISKIYEEVKGRPKFIISDMCGNDSDDSYK